MEYKKWPCIVEWDLGGADINFPHAEEVDTEFQNELRNQLHKKGLMVFKKGDGAPIIIRGRYVRIDKGDEFLRMIFIPDGRVVLEVEGTLIIKGRPVADLYAIAGKSRSIFNDLLLLLISPYIFSNFKSIMKRCIRSCAREIAGQVLNNLNKDDSTHKKIHSDCFELKPGYRSRRQWTAGAARMLKSGESADSILAKMTKERYDITEAQKMLDESIKRWNRRTKWSIGCSSLIFIAGFLIFLKGYLWIYGAILFFIGSIYIVVGMNSVVSQK
ncbi:hypothetical protein JW935_22150 [candidate division KSB1 bacterium]|nr:hypothetical protein [candidate division KSB1 bacterium]